MEQTGRYNKNNPTITLYPGYIRNEKNWFNQSAASESEATFASVIFQTFINICREMDHFINQINAAEPISTKQLRMMNGEDLEASLEVIPRFPLLISL